MQLAISQQPGLRCNRLSEVSEACSAGIVCRGLIFKWCLFIGYAGLGLAAYGSVYGNG